jgi:SAM-dependent methyltransferase
VAGLLLALITSTAIPFFVVSTTAPLLQNWLSRTTHAASSDPYFLYSASNAGSLLALIAYPFALEPRIGVAGQSQLWLWGYLGLMVMFAATVASLYSRGWTAMETHRQETAGWKQRAFWIAASFVPSALMLAVTNHVVANVGSVPFLWLMPLALYLLTFILAFARRGESSARITRLIPIPLLAFFPLLAPGIVASPGLNWILIGVHCAAALVWRATMPHAAGGEPARYTASDGVLFLGRLGWRAGRYLYRDPRSGSFQKRVGVSASDRARPFLPARPITSIGCACRSRARRGDTRYMDRVPRHKSGFEYGSICLGTYSGLFVGYKLSKLPKRFAAAFAVFVFAYVLILPRYIDRANGIYISRNFFGVKKVLDDSELQLRKLLHGDTIHGIESTDPARARGKPLSYYFKGGSVSDVIQMMRGRGNAQRLAVLGLGAGTMASYADTSHHVTFYEIDPSVEPIARQFFTFLSRCGSNCDVVVGDGRLQLAREPDQTFDFILLDAFSSDSVPTHLVSQEALQLYLAKLKADGVLLFNVSNRYLNVEKLVSALVADAGLVALARFDDAGDLKQQGKSAANHVAAARKLQDLGPLATLQGWHQLSRPENFRSWTDDYSNLLNLIRWH